MQDTLKDESAGEKDRYIKELKIKSNDLKGLTLK